MNSKKIIYKQMKQQGFSLSELLIYLIIASILIGLTITAYNGEGANAVALYSKMTEYSDNMKRMKLDTQCYPTQTGALFKKSLASTTYCGIDATQNWVGPYVNSTNLTSSNNISLSEYGDKNAELILPTQFTDQDLNGSGNSVQWVLVAKGIPAGIANEVMNKCNKGYTDTTKTTFRSGNCIFMSDDGSSASSDKYKVSKSGDSAVSIGYIFDERS